MKVDVYNFLRKADEAVGVINKLIDYAMPSVWALLSGGMFFDEYAPFHIGCPICRMAAAELISKTDIDDIHEDDFRFVVYFYVASMVHNVSVLGYRLFERVNIYHVFLRKESEFKNLIMKLDDISSSSWYDTGIIAISNVSGQYYVDMDILKDTVKRISEIITEVSKDEKAACNN